MKTTVKKRLSALICAMTAGLALTSCGGGDESDSGGDGSLNVTVSAAHVSDEALQSYADSFFATYPEWEGKVEITAQSMGSEETDGTMYGAQVMQQSAAVAAGELDIMICDESTAARGCRSELFYTLDEMFTEDEIAGFGETLSYEEVDTDGNPTGEMTAVCGVKLDSDQLDSIFGDDGAGIFVVANAGLEQSKQLFLDLIAAG